MDVDRPIEDVRAVVSVDGVEQLVAAEHAAVGVEDGQEQPELDVGQRDDPAGPGDLVTVRVDDEVGPPQPGSGRQGERLAVGSAGAAGVLAGRRGPAQDRLDPEHELGRRERLRQVVVDAVLEPGDPIERRTAGGEHQDRRGRRFVVAANRPDDRATVEVGQHQVEHDEGRAVALDGVEGGRPVRRGHDREAVALQVGADEPHDLGVVVDDQDRALGERRVRLRHRVHGRGARLGPCRDDPVTPSGLGPARPDSAVSGASST